MSLTIFIMSHLKLNIRSSVCLAQHPANGMEYINILPLFAIKANTDSPLFKVLLLNEIFSLCVISLNFDFSKHLLRKLNVGLYGLHQPQRPNENDLFIKNVLTSDFFLTLYF